MNNLSYAYEWAKTYNFNKVELQYATILALKILDKQCLMDDDNYNLFIHVYDGICDKPNSPFNKKVPQTIEQARKDKSLVLCNEYKDIIYNLRVAMIKDIHIPTMKAYKKMAWNNFK